MKREKIAAQMYGLRKEFEKDPDLTFKNLKEIGYEAIQLDGMRGNDPHEIKKLIDKYGFKIAGMHIHHRRFFDDLDGVVAEALLFGNKTVFDKYIDDEEQNTEGYIATKKRLHEVQDTLRKLDFRVGLHCPEYDYPNTVEGQRILSYITAPEKGIALISEPDTYWITVGGLDPVEEIKQFSGRCPIVHFKDYKKGFDPKDMDNNLTEVGSGDVDFKSLVEWGETHGVEYYCVEQDYSKIGIFNSMQKSFDYLINL